MYSQILPSVDHNSRKIRLANKNFKKINDVRDIKFPVNITDIHKIQKEFYHH